MEKISRNSAIKSRSSQDTEKVSYRNINEARSNDEHFESSDHDQSTIIFKSVEEELKEGINKIKEKFSS